MFPLCSHSDKQKKSPMIISTATATFATTAIGTKCFSQKQLLMFERFTKINSDASLSYRLNRS